MKLYAVPYKCGLALKKEKFYERVLHYMKVCPRESLCSGAFCVNVWVDLCVCANTLKKEECIVLLP